MKLAHLSLLVPDYDEGLAWFIRSLGWAVVADEDQGGGKRWVVVAPPGAGTSIVLARAVGDQTGTIGRQGGGRVWLFLQTCDFAADHARLSAAGVRFEEAPRHEPYGTVAVFADPWGNRWDLIGSAA